MSPSWAGAVRLIRGRFAASAEKNLTSDSFARPRDGSTDNVRQLHQAVRALRKLPPGGVGSAAKLTRRAGLRGQVFNTDAQPP